MDVIRLFVGHDRRESIALDVFNHSVMARSSLPLAITPLHLNNLRNIYREHHTDGSNEFIYTRFLVPYLCNFCGWAIFADGDMLCREDLAKLWRLRDGTKAVQVVKHNYKTKHPVKYLGARNEDYPRKNWSSIILWNCGHPSNSRLHPEVVMGREGSFLHRFSWLGDQEIGELPMRWNWLVGEYEPDPDAALVHFTLGTPCFAGYQRCDYANEWYAELQEVLHVADAQGHAWLKRAKR